VGVARKYLNCLNIVARDFVFPYFVGSFLTKLDKSMTGDDYEGLPFRVVPVFALGDSWLADVDTYLTAIESVEEFGERATAIYIHLEVVDGFLFRKITQIISL